MNYQKIHDQIIERAKHRQLEGYKERHHIIPRCMDGPDSADNLVDLTAREHFIVHKLLCEIYPDQRKLSYAYWMMCNMKSTTQHRNYKVTNRDYERARSMFSSIHSKRIISAETRDKLKHARLNNPVKYNVINYKHTDERREKIRQSKLGKKRNPISAEQKAKMSLKLKGRTLSEEHKKKISEARRRKTNL
jgi:hypothetical protein